MLILRKYDVCIYMCSLLLTDPLTTLHSAMMRKSGLTIRGTHSGSSVGEGNESDDFSFSVRAVEMCEAIYLTGCVGYHRAKF